jgi:NTE family protein
VLIRPPLGKITVASFERMVEAVGIGERAARAALPALQPLALSPEAYAAHVAARAARVAAAAPPLLAAERFVNNSRLSDRVIAARLDTPLGQVLDPGQIETDLNQVYGLELFESVYYDVAPGPEGNVLTVTARARTWGPDYIQGGVAAFEDFEGPNFNVALAYSRTGVNRLNGEWRTGLQVGQEPEAWTEFYQPLDRWLRTFVEVGLSGGERALNVFDSGGHKLSELGITHLGGELAVGRDLGTWGELRTGLLREGGRLHLQVGETGPPPTHYDTGEAFAQFFVDELDELAFPHHGSSLRARVSTALDALGSTVEYEQAVLEAAIAGTAGRNSGLLGAQFGTTRDSDAPLESRFRLGGLGQLSGLEQDELIGQHSLLLRTFVYRKLSDFQLFPVYAGLSGEYGNVFASRSAIALGGGIAAGSVFLGVDTVIGPICLAYGRAEGDRGNYYFTLGQPLGGRRPGFRFR